ncbi:Type II secretory pathway, component PulD [Prochlorococcus marinus str. MIT 9211]|uniref:Type II secretory pathway, component PulD n=1 Tax=Prochlorococcus marinus (strain MIT 9211) TaxID=93059 RepID=A9BA84_PROM4|nr:Type II secretory pathway, component PulD [Prochlorococcus marinus str. MIT 9211]
MNKKYKDNLLFPLNTLSVFSRYFSVLLIIFVSSFSGDVLQASGSRSKDKTTSNSINKNNLIFDASRKNRGPQAPPLGGMAVGEIFINSRGFVDLEGPKTTITLVKASPIDSLLTLSRIANYGFLHVKDNVDESSDKSTDLVTLSFREENYQKVLNSILLAAGLQGKQEGNILMVGKDVLSKSFGPQVSRVYRLNQVSASAAADYLGSLGAKMTKVWTKTNMFSGSESTDGISTATNGNPDEIFSYTSNIGPLRGLIGTTDSRLQTITLIGDPYLVSIAEKYLKQLDLRQRQVALSVKVIDVLLNNTTDMKNAFEYGIGDNYIINSESKGLMYMFGNKSFSPTDFSVTDSFSLASRKFMGWFRSKVLTNNAKILANPTLILGESQEEILGGSEVSGSLGLGDSTIGRPWANEGFVKVGTSVVTNYTISSAEDGSTLCEPQTDIAGITFGAKVHKIDDNGYVTFSLSPNISAVSETQSIGDCGNISTLSIRRLDTGNIRVRDGDTLVLTGVIKEDDTKAITKTPVLGDIPLFGRLFRTNSTVRKKSELIIMVTPKVIKDSLTYSKTNDTTLSDVNNR